MEKYEVYRLGNFSNIQQDKIATFYEFKLAIDFVNYMASIGENFGVFDQEGNRLDTE